MPPKTIPFYIFSFLYPSHLAEIGSIEPSLEWIIRVPIAFLGVIAYGPLEVFFFIWLVQNTEKALTEENVLFSKGLILTVIIYAVLHSFSLGLYSIVITGVLLALCIIYKYNRNAIGPMIGFIFVNQFLLSLCGVIL